MRAGNRGCLVFLLELAGNTLPSIEYYSGFLRSSEIEAQKSKFSKKTRNTTAPNIFFQEGSQKELDAKPQAVKTTENRRMHRHVLEIYRKIKNSSLYSNAFYLMLNTAATSVLGFAFWNIMARSFSHADVGIGSALTAASGLVSTIATQRLINYIWKHRAEQNKPVAQHPPAPSQV